MRSSRSARGCPARHPGQRGPSRRRPARLADLGRRLAQGARRQHGHRRGPARGAYRQRSLLKRSVHPEDIAEAVLFFASETSAKSTGNLLDVDAGNQIAFSR
jgi:NAD(P)-dependent dehydrogenase (short-subunit alcohol dehydrogenase family)